MQNTLGVSKSTALAWFMVVASGVTAYVTILDNFFISDDFVMFSFLRVLEKDPGQILRVPPEIFRVTSYLYFMLCYKLFGPDPAAYYASGIIVHVLASVLTFLIVLRMSSNWGAGWAAALFFATYERHQEAVMWISAANDTLVTLFSLLCLLNWKRYLVEPARSRRYCAAALLTFILALFSKEAAVILLPVMLIMQALKQDRDMKKNLWTRYAPAYFPFVLCLVSYLAYWFSQRQENFFLALGFYSFGPHFFPVYARSLGRLLVQPLLFAVVLLLARWRYRRKPEEKRESAQDPAHKLLVDRALIFFLCLLLLAIAPYCFLTYLDHIPSRNTYLPSVGVAGLVGILVARLHSFARSNLGRVAVVAFFLAVISVNVVYLWTKKESQYNERARPTQELIRSLNEIFGEVADGRPVYVYSFPLQQVIGNASVEIFTSFPTSQVIFIQNSQPAGDQRPMLRWDSKNSRFETSH